MKYSVRPGDSPTIIAHRHGVSFDRLIAANPHKPTTMVAGRRTWRSIATGETIMVPTGGMVGGPGTVGDIWSDAIKPLVNAGGPCLQANVNLTCAAQVALGVTADGKWGSSSAAAAAGIAGAPPACSPRPSWWAPKGQSNCGASAAPRAASTPSGGGLAVVASAALAALNADPNYCSSVSRVGSPVNTGVHNFKAAWNASNPSNPVPIGTGKYEPVVASALSSALGGVTVPPGCGAAAAAPPPVPAPSPAPAPAPSPGPGAAAAPAAVQMLLGLDPCAPQNVDAVCAAQRALGVSPDGKYGNDTAAAAKRLAPDAPGGCSPRPSWWTPKGSSNCRGAAPPPGPMPPPPPPPQPIGATVPPAVQALASINPCLQSNVEVVRNAQRAVGVSPDGKYGNDTAAAARKFLPSAPAGCSPRPSWWTPKGTSQPIGPPVPPPPPSCPSGTVFNPTSGQCEPQKAPPPAPCPSGTTFNPATGNCESPVSPPTPAGCPAGTTMDPATGKCVAPSGGGGTTVVVPAEKKGLSTGAIVAGAVGAAALVGLVAMAMTGKKGHRGARGKRGPSGHKKSSHRRKSSHKRKR